MHTNIKDSEHFFEFSSNEKYLIVSVVSELDFHEPSRAELAMFRKWAEYELDFFAKELILRFIFHKQFWILYRRVF